MTVHTSTDGEELQAWCARIQRLLELGKKGVLVLLQGAGPEHLGPLVRNLWSQEAAHVCLKASEIEDLTPGSLVVLTVSTSDAAWLNTHRPLFARRRLRVLLLANDETAGGLARTAPDFFDWISHVVQCPHFLRAHLVASLKVYRAAPGIRFFGADAQEYLRKAFPDEPLEVVVGPVRYEELVRAFQDAQDQRVVVLADVHPVRLRWAMAEARHKGGCVVGFAVPGWPSLDATPTSFGALAGLLPSRSGDLMAAVDAEPEALALASELERKGWSTHDLFEAAKVSDDGGAAFGTLLLVTQPRMGNEAGLWIAPSPVLRAHWRTKHAPSQQSLRVRHIESRLIAGQVPDASEMAAWASASQSAALTVQNLAPAPYMVFALEPCLRQAEVPWRDLARFATDAGQYDVAVSWAVRAVQLAESRSDAPQLGKALFCLGEAKSYQGKYVEAEALHRQSLTIKEAAFGKDHPDYGASLHALAGVLLRQGRYDEAEVLLRQVLALTQRGMGEDHPDFAASLHMLAEVLSRLGKYAEAEAMHKQSVVLAERLLGKDHPHYAASVNGLAGVLLKQGKYNNAEALLRESLASREVALGQDHPDYCASLDNLASVLSKQGKYAEATVLLRQSLEIKGRILGKDHPDYGASQHVLALALAAEGGYPEAETLLRQSLEIKGRILGKDHPDYGASQHALAGVVSKQGKYAEAEALLRQSLKVTEQALGRDHPSLAPTLCNLGVLMGETGRLSGAEGLIRRALKISQKVHGPDHPDVVAISEQLVWVQASLSPAKD